jgi:hypothetical protein
LIGFLVEALIEILFEFFAGLGVEAIGNAIALERDRDPMLAIIGQFFLGLILGVVSLLIIPHRVAPAGPVPGVSLVVAPLVSGAAMQGIGTLWVRFGWDRPAIFTFRGGAIVGFAMGLMRFSYLQLHWLPHF